MRYRKGRGMRKRGLDMVSREAMASQTVHYMAACDEKDVKAVECLMEWTAPSMQPGVQEMLVMSSLFLCLNTIMYIFNMYNMVKRKNNIYNIYRDEFPLHLRSNIIGI